MEFSLSNTEEILMNLLTIIPIVPICKDIIRFKNKMEKLATDKKAGYDKLIELGLTADQITALTGYTPPAE